MRGGGEREIWRERQTDVERSSLVRLNQLSQGAYIE
jgi:hypothetical protein